ncbi:MAG: protein kinase, partial [Terriglobia bacterium]
MIGKTLGHYRIIEKIGAGGMGEVYRARDERLERDVALKVLPAGALADEAARKRFRKEALALSKLNHPNIETVYDFDTQDGVDFLVMEHIAGETLDAKVKQGALGEKEVARLGAQLAEGLAAAHAAGVVHRDLKPGNLRVTPDGRLKILDFGLAKLLRPAVDPASAATAESLTETQAVAGTLPYMAPEQLRGETVDARTDLWAAGAVLYEMAAGRRPFEAKLATALTDDILHKPPPSPGRLNPDLSSRLEEITLRCLEKDPEHRYQSARDLLADFRRLSAPPAPAAPATLAAKPSVAVLPFQNLSADPENEYFSDGMTEEIISKLSRIQQLQVASRTSVARFKGTQKDIKEVGQELGVRYVLEGSVRKAGNRVRITAQLIDTSSGFHLWAEDFQGELKDVFAVQEETALKIAAALNLRLSPQEQRAVQRRTTDNPKAYDAYLRGRALAEHADNREKLEAARRQFEQALEADSDYAPALAGLSLVESAYYRNLDRSEARRQLAEQLARRALALDPDLPEAHFAFGYVHGEPPVM